MKRLRGMIEHLRYRYAPRIVDYVVKLSTSKAAARLRASGPLGVLVDNTVLDHAVTHETAWIPTGKAKWGATEIETGYSARIAVHPADSQSREYRNVRFLPGLVSLARQGLLTLHTSAEIDAERFHQPIGRFRGYGYLDLSLLSGVEIKSVDGRVFPTLGPEWMELPTSREQQHQRLKRAEDEDTTYASLVEVLGRKNSQDAWHIRTAEKFGLFCFLTMDFGLLDTLAAQRNANRVKAMATKVMTPEQLGRCLGLFPLPPHLLSYHAASFPVRSDLAWPDGRRKGAGR